MATHTDRCIEILQAYKNGKVIRFRQKSKPQYGFTSLLPNGDPGWDFDDYEYKIDGESEEPEYRPWTFDEIKIGLCVKSKKGWIEGMITRKERGFDGKVDKLCIGDVKHTAATLLREFLTYSGEPCGVKK